MSASTAAGNLRNAQSQTPMYSVLSGMDQEIEPTSKPSLLVRSLLWALPTKSYAWKLLPLWLSHPPWHARVCNPSESRSNDLTVVWLRRYLFINAPKPRDGPSQCPSKD